METGTFKGLFQQVEIFKELTEAEIMDIIRASKVRDYKPGEVIFDAGQAGDAMYLVHEGRIRILQVLPDGTREILANLEKGQVFGEMAILDNAPRSARAMAVSPSKLYRIDRSDFNTLRANEQPAAFKLIRAIARVLSLRMRETNWRVVNFFEDPERSLEYLKSRQQMAR